MTLISRYVQKRLAVLLRVAVFVIGVVALVVLEPLDSWSGAVMFVGALCAAGLLIDFLDRRYLRSRVSAI